MNEERTEITFGMPTGRGGGMKCKFESTSISLPYYMVLDFQIMANRNREECFVCDGLRGRRHDMTSLRVMHISCEEKICSYVLLLKP